MPKNRLLCLFPAVRPVRPARNFPETKKIICPMHAAHVGHMIGDLVQSFPAPRKLLPPLRRSPSLEEGGLWGGESGVCRMSAGNCNCEMRLQRWVASLQRLDAFATVGCTAVHRRGAHCAPVYLRCYNNLSSGRAKGHRGDRKAPISNRRQGRRP